MEETKERKTELSLRKLVSHLEDLSGTYQNLFKILNSERQCLIAADLIALEQNNSKKEELIYKLRSMDQLREKYAREVAQLAGAPTQAPRLLEIADRLPAVSSADLKKIHAHLQDLMVQVQTLNSANETYAKSALSTLSGAMGDVKETLAPKKTYGVSGKMAHGPDQSGNFVRKEA